MVVGPSNFGFKVSNGIVFGCTLYALLLSVYMSQCGLLCPLCLVVGVLRLIWPLILATSDIPCF